MSVRIRLKRMGKKKQPYYRIVVTDSSFPRDGRFIEEIGYYHPLAKEEKQIFIKENRINEWLKKGATPSGTVKQILNRSLKTDKE